MLAALYAWYVPWTRTYARPLVVRYLQLAHNVLDAKAGCAKAQVPCNFGRVTSGLRFEESRPVCGSWLLLRLWEQLGIPAAIRNFLAERAFRTEVDKAIFAMVANRCLAP